MVNYFIHVIWYFYINFYHYGNREAELLRKRISIREYQKWSLTFDITNKRNGYNRCYLIIIMLVIMIVNH